MCRANSAGVEFGRSAGQPFIGPHPSVPVARCLNPLTVGTTAALSVWLVLCGCGGPRGELRVLVEPPDAVVTCNGKRYDAGSPLVLSRLPAGTYYLVAEKEGYRAARRTVTLLEDQRATIELRLEPETALVLIESVPPGAEVHINGIFRGRTPFFVNDLPLGEHRFAFALPGYLPAERIENIPNRIPRAVRAELTANVGRLVIRSAPPGATVRINGAVRGVTPLDLDQVPAGDIRIELLLEGFESFETWVTLAARETREVSATLRPHPTELTVVSLPPGARVYVNNLYRGETPVKITDLEPGEHRLRVEMRGYETMARTILLRSQQPAVEEFRLVKNSGKIVLVTEPPAVKVFLNGEEKGETRPGPNPLVSEPLEIDLLPPGEYRVALFRPGFEHKPRIVSLAANEVVTLHERMSRVYVPDTRVRIRGAHGEIVREGMLLRNLPDGGLELMLDTGTIMAIPGDELLSKEPLVSHP